MTNKEMRTFEDDLMMLAKRARHHPIMIKDLVFFLFGKGRPLLVILFSLPFCQPFMIPGLSTLFGIFIAFIGLRIAFGRKILIPAQYLNKKISSKHLKKIIAKTLFWLNKLKKWTRPRYLFLIKARPMIIVNGIAIFIMGLFLALPLPIPLSNFLTAWSLLLAAFGLLENDGLFVLIGYFIFTATIVIYLQLGQRIAASF